MLNKSNIIHHRENFCVSLSINILSIDKRIKGSQIAVCKIFPHSNHEIANPLKVNDNAPNKDERPLIFKFLKKKNIKNEAKIGCRNINKDHENSNGNMKYKTLKG